VSGKALRGLLESGELPSVAAEETMGNFAVFLARLHLKGVLFRSIHFGNVMVLLDGSFALVDIADINYRYFGALTPRQRIRNFIHMSRYEQDRRALKNFGIDRFVKIYMDASEMHAGEKQHFSKLFDSKMRKTYVDPLERI
jgi:hypothetical protein